MLIYLVLIQIQHLQLIWLILVDKLLVTTQTFDFIQNLIILTYFKLLTHFFSYVVDAVYCLTELTSEYLDWDLAALNTFYSTLLIIQASNTLSKVHLLSPLGEPNLFNIKL